MTKSDKSLEILEKRKRIYYKDVINILIFIIGMIIIWCEAKALYNNYLVKNYYAISYNTLIIFIMIGVNIYNVINKINEDKYKIYAKKLEERNKNLLEVTDNIRCFKHDFNNIMQAITGYLDVKDIDALQKYFNCIAKECHHMNMVEILNYQVMENPAIYSVLINKYRKAKEMDITMNIEILISLNKFAEKTYVISRMLGILLDNALEATSECPEKTINIRFISDKNKNRDLIIIENTYVNKNIDINKIFEKDYTTKDGKTNSGLGLWKIRDILRNDTSLELFTTKNDEMFKQQLDIYS